MKRFLKGCIILLLLLVVGLCFTNQASADVPEVGDKFDSVYSLVVDGVRAVDEGIVKVPKGKGWSLNITNKELILDNYKGGQIYLSGNSTNTARIKVKGYCEITADKIGIEFRSSKISYVKNLEIDLMEGDLYIFDALYGIYIDGEYGSAANLTVSCGLTNRHNLIIYAGMVGIYCQNGKGTGDVYFNGRVNVGINLSGERSLSTGIATGTLTIGSPSAVGISTPDRSHDYAMSTSDLDFSKLKLAFTKDSLRYGKADGSGGNYIIYPKNFYDQWKLTLTQEKDTNMTITAGESLKATFRSNGEDWARASGLKIDDRVYYKDSDNTAYIEIPVGNGYLEQKFAKADTYFLSMFQDIYKGKELLASKELYKYLYVEEKKLTPISKVEITLKDLTVGKSMTKATTSGNVTIATSWSPSASSAAAHKTYKATITVTTKSGYTFTDSTKVYVNGKQAGYNLSSGTKLVTWDTKTTGHGASTTWSYDSSNHWKSCSGCSQKMELAPHTIKTEYTNNGYTLKKTCTVCGWTTSSATSAGTIEKVFMTFPLPVVGEKRWWYYGSTNKGYDTSKFKLTDGLCTPGNANDPNADTEIFDDNIWQYNLRLESTEGKYFSKNMTTKDIIYEKFDKSQVVYSEGLSVSNDGKTLYYQISVHPVSQWAVGVTAKTATPGVTKLFDALPSLSNTTSSMVIGNMSPKYGYTWYKDGTKVLSGTCSKGVWTHSGDVSQKFQDGHYYEVVYTLSVAGSFNINGVKTLNKANTVSLSYSNGVSDLYVSAIYDFSYIDNVALVNLGTPVAGQKANALADPASPNYYLSYADWGKDVKTFSCGKTYTYTATITTTGDSNFAPAKQLTVTVNGKKATIINRTEDQVDVEVQFKSSAHSYGDWETVTEAGCDSEGSMTRSCSVCGHTETSTIPALGHTFIFVEGNPGNCISEGVSDHYMCQGCGILSKDSDGKALTSNEQDFVLQKDPNNHVGGEMELDKNEHWIHCQCGALIDREAHSFGEDNICTVCGYEKGKDPVKPADQDDPAQPDKPDNPDNPDNPGETEGEGLNWLLIIVILLVAVAAFMVTLVLRKKNNK